MQNNERRFRQRYDASPLKLEIRRLNWFGRPKKAHHAIGRDFALGGIAIITPLKLKPGQRLLLTLENMHHRLQSVPAVVVRSEMIEADYLCALKFAIGELPEPASRGVYTILKRLETTLKEPSAA